MTINAAYSETVMLALERQRGALVHIDTVATSPELSLVEAWQVVTKALSEAMQAARVSVWFLDESKETLACADLFLAEDGSHESGAELCAGEYPRYFVALTHERAIDAHHASTDPRTSEFADNYLAPLGISSMLDAPIRRDGKVVGVVCVEHQGKPRRWRLDEVLCAGAAGDLLAKIAAAHERREVQEALALREEQVRQMQKMEAIGQLAGGIAHDFNNILAGIMGSTGVVEATLTKENRRGLEAVGLIRRSGERARDLVSKLLAFSRKSKELWTSFHLHEILDDALTLFQRGGAGNVRVMRDFADADIIVQGDPVDLQMALLNLFINAGDAMPNGGVLQVRSEFVDASRLPLRLRRDGGTEGTKAIITVTDTGEGIDADVLEKIYEPFFTTKPIGKGTGLGLSAVYAIVLNHDGVMDVQSEPGHGTSFSLVLPAVGEGSESESVPRLPGRELKAAHILVVDDEEVLRTVATLLLEQLGHSVTVAQGGREVLAIVEDQACQYDAILMDMTMPGMSGEECFRALKKLAPETPILICTGYAQSSSIDRVVQLGASGVLHKPYTLRQLDESLRLLLLAEDE